MPIVVFFAPVGAFFASHFHRQVLASILYVLELIALIGFLLTKPSLKLILIGFAIILFALILFYIISKIGYKINNNNIDDEYKKINSKKMTTNGNLSNDDKN